MGGERVHLRFVALSTIGRIKILSYAIAKAVKRTLTIFLCFPLLWNAVKMARHSEKNIIPETSRDVLVYCLELVALSYGEFKSLMHVYRKEKEMR